MAQVANWPIPPPGSNAVGSAGSAEGVIFPSAAYGVGTQTTPAIQNPGAKGIRLFVNVTNANGGTAGVSVEVQDPASGAWVAPGDGFSSGLVASNITNGITIYPGIGETTGSATVFQETSDHVGTPFRIKLIIATATVTCSVGGIFLA